MPMNERNRIRAPQIYELRTEQRLTYGEIGKRFGISDARARMIFNQYRNELLRAADRVKHF